MSRIFLSIASNPINSSRGIENNGATRANNGIDGNLTSVEKLSGDESLTREILLEKLKILIKLLKKQDEDGIPQGSLNVNTKVNKDDTLEKVKGKKKCLF